MSKDGQTLDMVNGQPTPPQVATRAVAGLPADSLQQSIMNSNHLCQHHFSGSRPGLSGTAPAVTASTTINQPELVVLLPQGRKLGLQPAHMIGHHAELSAITPSHGAHAPSIKLVYVGLPLMEVAEKIDKLFINKRY